MNGVMSHIGPYRRNPALVHMSAVRGKTGLGQEEAIATLMTQLRHGEVAVTHNTAHPPM